MLIGHRRLRSERRRQPSHTSRSLVSSRQAEARRQAFQAESRSHGAKEPAKATARRFARSLPRPSSPDQRHRDRSPHDREFGRHGCGLAVWQPQNRGCPHGQPGNGRRDAQVQRPYAASSYKGPYSRSSPSCIQFGRPVGAWRITAIVKIRPQAAGSFISCARAASAGSTATRFIENNARYVEYCGAECVGLY